MIENIEINRICPHPDNPRKDLGDLAELAESIKTNGILQNLTVVPWISTITGCPSDNQETDPIYTAVIGHRRLAAAKLAGLTEVPCVISDMDHKTQVATMLLENMQRSDLTVYEQAQGFQMMLDLGETLEGLTKATGFSATTVRHRIKLLELDQDKLKKSMGSGATLMDFAELEKIQGAELKNKVLESIGTSNFKWELNKAIEEEGETERKTELIEELETFAKKVKSENGLVRESTFWSFRKSGWEKPKDAETTEYFYIVDKHMVALLKKPVTADEKEVSLAEKEFKEKEAKLKSLTAQSHQMRHEFVKDFSTGKKYAKEINAFIMHKLLAYGRAELSNMLEMFNMKEPAKDEESGYNHQKHLELEAAKRSLVMDKYEEQPEKVLLVGAYLGLGDSKSNSYYSAQSWRSKIEHMENESLDLIYDTLTSLGYQMSDEEQALRSGTHELFEEKQ